MPKTYRDRPFSHADLDNLSSLPERQLTQADLDYLAARPEYPRHVFDDELDDDDDRPHCGLPLVLGMFAFFGFAMGVGVTLLAVGVWDFFK